MSLHETLTAHPLLSPHTSPNTSPDITPPKYVPYTPRQRVSAITTGTTVTASVSNSPRDATSKLQLMNLKAAAQTVGLDTGTVGWAILEKLVLESSGECSDIWQAVTAGRATLLLPLETAAPHEQLHADFVKDHVVLCDGPSRKNAPVLTLSGLRGVLNGQTLTLRSSVHPSSKQFQHLLLDPTSRSSDLALLPPLPLIPSTQSPYPAFSVPSYTSSLPLPPLTKPAPKPKPPLPPRPVSHPPSLAASQTPSQSRLSFASLFGKPTPTPAATPPVIPISASPTPSVLSLDSNNNQDSEHGAAILVNAFTLDRRIVRKDVEKEIGKGLKAEVEGALALAFEDNDKDATEWIAERVHEFTRDAGLYPFVKSVGGGKRKLAMLREKNNSSSSDREDEWVVNSLQMSPEDMEDRFQAFYAGLEEELKKKGLDEQQERIAEVVERTICRLFYDRLFLQPTSDDASHDEALSSRVAALNMLDLSLEHLDVDVGDAGEQLELVVKACGETLTRLDDATSQSPGEKAAILVSAHKIIVDGMSKLPPIRLKSEVTEEKSRKESQTKPSSKPVEVEKQVMEAWVPEAATVASPSSETGHEHAFDVDPTQQALPPSPDQTKRSKSPTLLISPPSPPHPASVPDPQEPPPHTTVSGDILLPLIIFSVVKANPPHLVSHLLYTQRFRNHSIGGEESYCLVNLLAVAEFLENVDLGALGLGGSDKVMSTADLTPIPINRSPMTPDTPLSAPPHPHDAYGGIRGRVEQQVDAIAGSANKVITGVVDSSFGILRSFSLLPTSPDPVTPAPDGLQVTAPWNSVRPGFGLLRRESGFSIAGIAAALPGGGGSIKSGEEVGQPLLTVSRPASVKSYKSSRSRGDKGDGSDSSSEEEEESGDEEEEDADGSDEDEGEDEDEDDGGAGTEYDTRSIRSFESMMSAGKKHRNVKRSKDRNGNGARRSLTDRLAHMSAALKGTPPASRRSSSLLPPGFGGANPRFDTPASSRPQSPLSSLRLAPPNQRFLECSEDDIKVSEVKDLLKEYRRLVEAVRAVDGFDE